MAEPDVDELITLLLQTVATLRPQRRRDSDTGLGPSHHMLMWRLGSDEGFSPWPRGPARVSELAQALRLTPAAITQLVAELEGRGFVRRTRDDRDRRAVRVSLTDAGEEVLATHRRRRHAVVRRLAEALAPEDRAALARILIRLRETGLGSVDSDE